MAISLAKFRVRFDIDWATARTATELEAAVAEGNMSDIHTIGDGTAAGQCNQLFSDRRVVAASANDDLDMAGTLTNVYGEVITFLLVRGIYVRNISANPITRLLVMNTGSTLVTVPWIVPVVSGGLFVAEDFYAGEAAVGGTGDLLRITNADSVNSATYEIVIIGTS